MANSIDLATCQLVLDNASYTLSKINGRPAPAHFIFHGPICRRGSVLPARHNPHPQYIRFHISVTQETAAAECHLRAAPYGPIWGGPSSRVPLPPHHRIHKSGYRVPPYDTAQLRGARPPARHPHTLGHISGSMPGLYQEHAQEAPSMPAALRKIF